MIGITSWGSYIPVWRLSRGAIGGGMLGEKAIAGFDEDSITMAVAATMDCLKDVDRQGVDGLFFATTTSPYKEKLGSAMVATAADSRRDIITADFFICRLLWPYSHCQLLTSRQKLCRHIAPVRRFVIAPVRWLA